MSEAESAVVYEGRDLEALSDMPNYYAWIMQRFESAVRGVTVEYGAGVGTVSALLRARSDWLTLVEPSANLNASLRARFQSDERVAISDLMLEAHVATLEDASVDTLVLVNVLEHIEDDDAAVRELARVLKPGGHLLIFVPALSVLMSDLDRDLGHFRRYHHQALRMQLGNAGLNVRDSRYFDILGVAPWFLFNTVMGAKNLNPKMLKVYDGLVVPISRGLERIGAPPFGKNILAVAQKPA